MGEAKRRKKLDPNYGNVRSLAGHIGHRWREVLSLTNQQWVDIKSYFRFVATPDDVDFTVDGIWFYFYKGRERLGLTGRFISYFPDDYFDTDVIVHARDIDSPEDIDDSLDAVWKYRDGNGVTKISYTGSFAHEFAPEVISNSYI